MSSFALTRIRARRRARKPLPPNWRRLALAIAFDATLAILNAFAAVHGSTPASSMALAAGMTLSLMGDLRHWRAGGYDHHAQAECGLPAAVTVLLSVVLLCAGL